MTWFIFVGDMLVMLFMTLLVVWVSVRGTGPTLDYSASIPLRDESLAPEGDTHG
ncbi:MAG: hypothetical protein RLZZ227_901 [Pseudomonadota bacterium]|jgi:hypothetical protein